MSKSYDFGQAAENRASQYLQQKGYLILARNYRYLKAEIDLIALENNTLIVVEVKARSSSYFGSPASFIGKKKIRLLVQATDHYMQSKNLSYEVRFDILSFVYEKGKWQVEHLKEAFYPFT